MNSNTQIIKKIYAVFDNDFVDCTRPFSFNSCPSYVKIARGEQRILARGANEPHLNSDADLVIPHGVCYNVHLTVPKEFFHLEEETIMMTKTRRVI